MKRSFLGTTVSVAVVAMILAFNASAQTTFLDENFDAVAGGTVAPAGWTKFITVGSAEWRFDDPSAVAPTGGNFAGGQASISSDFAGGGTSPHDATLQSPDMDLSGAATVIMNWDHYARMLSATTLTVSVFDGVTDNIVFVQAGGSDVGTPTSPVAESFDITALAGGAVNAHVSFNYTSGFDWWWYVDNVNVFEPLALSGQAPRTGESVFDVNGSLNANGLPVASGDNGPFQTTLTPGTTMTMSWEGSANYPIACFYGNLNPVSATFPGGIGQTDVGGPGLDPMTGFPLGIGVFADGIGFAGNPGSLALDSFMFCDAAGIGGITLPFPSFGLAPGSTLTTFQCTMSSPMAPFFKLSNAVEIITN